jgi:hypothetical protein
MIEEMEHRLNTMRACGLLVAGMAACSGQANPPPGYLTAVGPPPLRFQSLLSLAGARQEKLNTLPSLDPASESSAAFAPKAPDAPPFVSSPAASGALGNTNEFTGPLAQSNLSPATQQALVPSRDGQPADAAPLVAPQMLVHFFTQPALSNRAATISMPVGFSPASPPAPVSSSATYTSPSKP